MKILLVEPFFTGSHKSWCEGFAENSRHEIKILSLEGRYWKWRMYGGAVALANHFKQMDWQPDLLLASDMLDLATFIALVGKQLAGIPKAIYFHENQLTYPWSPQDEDVKHGRDAHYAFTNYTSALVADKVFFNSAFHQKAFLEELPKFLKVFPDHQSLETVEEINKKSSVLPLGLPLSSLDSSSLIGREPNVKPLILWNHRWEYDKKPEVFFQALLKLVNADLDFEVAILGERYRKYPKIFDEALITLGNRVVHFGYAESFTEYAEWLWKADILPVTSVHDFFGASVVEAIYCNTYPLLPNRLAYPEHIPKVAQSEHIYQNQLDLVQKLTWAIEHIDSVRNTQTQHFVEKYDWQSQVDLYDSEMEALKTQSMLSNFV